MSFVKGDTRFTQFSEKIPDGSRVSPRRTMRDYSIHGQDNSARDTTLDKTGRREKRMRQSTSQRNEKYNTRYARYFYPCWLTCFWKSNCLRISSILSSVADGMLLHIFSVSLFSYGDRSGKASKNNYSIFAPLMFSFSLPPPPPPLTHSLSLSNLEIILQKLISISIDSPRSALKNSFPFR